MTEAYREKCLSEKGQECTICGSRKNIEVHHIDGDRSNNDLANLAPVCRSCHSGIHSDNAEFAEWQGKILPDEQRTQEIRFSVTPEMKETLELVKLEIQRDTYKGAIQHILSEYREVYQTARDYENELPEGCVSTRRNSTIEVSDTVERVFQKHSEELSEVMKHLS